jgi:hypothetical protein
VKAALLPLGFWLPDTYGSAPAPVAALFALMTKVGVYAVLRVSMLMFGADGGPMAGLGTPALLVLGLATIGVGALGTFTAVRLKGVVAFLVIVSAGTLLASLTIRTAGAVGGAVYYLAHSTVAAALLFLLADAIGRRRGALGDRLLGDATAPLPLLLGLLFLGAATAIAGLPPLPGFVGKVTILPEPPAGRTPRGCGARSSPAASSSRWPSHVRAVGCSGRRAPAAGAPLRSRRVRDSHSASSPVRRWRSRSSPGRRSGTRRRRPRSSWRRAATSSAC